MTSAGTANAIRRRDASRRNMPPMSSAGLPPSLSPATGTTPASQWRDRAYTACLDDNRRDPQDLHRLFRGARPQAPAVLVADPRRARPLGALHGRGDASTEALLPGRRAAAAS